MQLIWMSWLVCGLCLLMLTIASAMTVVPELEAGRRVVELVLLGLGIVFGAIALLCHRKLKRTQDRMPFKP